MNMPADLMYPLPPFASAFHEQANAGTRLASRSKLAIVGLARNCADHLARNLGQLEQLAGDVRRWCLHIEANDCTDDTLSVLAAFANKHRQATFHYQDYRRPQLSAEFSGPRTIAMAEYRRACQRWVRDCAADADFVAVVDWDMWGGWSPLGLMAGLAWLNEMPDAYGMASVSLFHHDFGHGPQWVHYDLWALRGVGQAGCYFDTYRHGCGGFGYTWFPPVGSPPVLVSSAFGGMAIYRTAAYLSGTYAGETDCEHVTFHQSVAERTGQRLYVCPSMRTIMSWMEPTDAGNGVNSVPSVSIDAP